MLSIILPTALSGSMLLGMYDPAAFNSAIPDRLPDNLDSVVCTTIFVLAFFGLVFVSQLETSD